MMGRRNFLAVAAALGASALLGGCSAGERGADAAETDAPLAESGEAGTLAYYAPWGDVVMFYGPFSPNGALYELGWVVDGEERISELSGTIEVAL